MRGSLVSSLPAVSLPESLCQNKVHSSPDPLPSVSLFLVLKSLCEKCDFLQAKPRMLPSSGQVLGDYSLNSSSRPRLLSLVHPGTGALSG